MKIIEGAETVEDLKSAIKKLEEEKPQRTEEKYKKKIMKIHKKCKKKKEPLLIKVLRSELYRKCQNM